MPPAPSGRLAPSRGARGRHLAVPPSFAGTSRLRPHEARHPTAQIVWAGCMPRRCNGRLGRLPGRQTTREARAPGLPFIPQLGGHVQQASRTGSHLLARLSAAGSLPTLPRHRFAFTSIMPFPRPAHRLLRALRSPHRLRPNAQPSTHYILVSPPVSILTPDRLVVGTVET